MKYQKGTIEDFCSLAPLSPESIEAQPNQLTSIRAENEELRRIVRWCLRHTAVELPEEMQATFNRISGVNQ
jgi:hypothetical protein